MKVIQVNATADAGSTGRICADLMRGLHLTGHQAKIAYSTGREQDDGFRIGHRLDVKLHAAGARISGWQGYGSWKATDNLLRWLDREEPNVVHLHNLHANFVHVPKLLEYLAARDIATVITLHDCWFMTGKCTYYSEVGCDRWRSECGECPLLRNDIPSLIFDHTTQMKADKNHLIGAIPRLAVVGVSDWIADEAKMSHLASAGIIARISNWVNTSLYFPEHVEGICEQMGIQSTTPVVLGVASAWSERKRLGSFLALARRNPDLAVVLVGALPAGVVLPSNVYAVGTAENADVLRRWYSRADVFVNMSRMETFGLVTAEAMACGTPVIVFDETGCAEPVGPGCGIVLMGDSESQLDDALRTAISAGRISWSKNCVKHVETYFDRDRQVGDYIRLYEGIASGSEECRWE